jgi:hypothetical protein
MTGADGMRRRLTGSLRVALPPDQAFGLFTPRGEEAWVPGWAPHFPASTDTDARPGTVFQTGGHLHTATWVVTDSEWGRRVAYARVVPGFDAGTVSVTLEDADGQTDVTVTYDLTALTEEGTRQLRRFADDYPGFLRSWHDAIAAAAR